MHVVVDPFYSELGSRVVLLGGFELLPLEFKHFPDGEFYVRFTGDVSGLDVCLIMGCLPFRQSECFLRSVFFINTLKDLGARRIIVAFPYLPYSRQDKRFLSGECVSARVFVNTLFSSGADMVVTIDVHSMDVFSIFGDKFVNVSSLAVWREFLNREFKDGFFLVSPDEGRAEFISDLARSVGSPFTTFKKVRNLRTGKISELEPVNLDELKSLSNSYSTAIVLDDIISTGGTVARVVKELRKFFDGKVVTMFTHGLFLPGSIHKLLDAGVSRIISTDTVKNSFAEVSVAPLLVSFLRNIT